MFLAWILISTLFRYLCCCLTCTLLGTTKLRVEYLFCQFLEMETAGVTTVSIEFFPSIFDNVISQLKPIFLYYKLRFLLNKVDHITSISAQ